jgi:hypothetical protein
MIKKYRSLLAKAIPIVIVLLIVLTYRDSMRAIILVPVAYVIFIFRLITANINQEILWITFVIISIVIALLSLGSRWNFSTEETTAENKYPTRLHDWINIVHKKQHNEYFKWNLAQDLSNLFIEAIAYRQGISRSQVLQRLSIGTLDLPDDILAYLQISQTPFSQTGLTRKKNGNWFSRIRDMLRNHSNIQVGYGQSSLDLEPERIIHYLEDYLEFDPEIWEGEDFKHS